MRLITTHISADFDGLASMVAARKIYPDAVIAFSGSQERNVRDFISQSLPYAYDFSKIKDIDLKAVDTLILVDTRSSERIGPFKECLKNPGIKLHLYDHHLQNSGDLHGEVEIVEDFGSTTTLLVNILQEQKITITPIEATILALGIYEDTGSLTHLTTTPEDLMAALQAGADGYLLKDIEPEDLMRQLGEAARGKITISERLTQLLVASLREKNRPTGVNEAGLTEQESRILEHLIEGKSNKLIARDMGIAEGTVKVHVKHLLKKLNLRSRLEAAVWADRCRRQGNA